MIGRDEIGRRNDIAQWHLKNAGIMLGHYGPAAGG